MENYLILRVTIIKILNSNDNLFDVMDDLYLAYFYSDFCGPCKILGPIIESLPNSINKIKVNVYEHMDLSSSLNINSVPTVILFKDGEALERFVGLTPKQKLIDAYSYWDGAPH